MQIFWKIKPSFMSDANLIIKSASWCMNLGLFFACVYLKEIENYFMLLGVCDWYTLLKTPDNMVSIPSTILWGKVVPVTEQVVYEFTFPSLSGPEIPVNQGHKANRFLLPLLASIKIPGHQVDYFLPYWPGRSQVPDIVTGQGNLPAHRALSTKSSYKS